MAAALTITGNTNDALAAIAKLERQYDALENKIKRLRTESNKPAGGFDEMAKGAQKFAGELVGITSGMAAVWKGIQLANDEWKDFTERQDKAKDANLAFAQTLTKLSLATDQPLNEVKAQIQRLSTENNVKMQDIPEMLNRFQAAKGPTQGMADVEKTFVAAARLAKFDKDSMSQLGETALDITKQMPGVTAEQALGFSLDAQAQSRVADPAAFNKNVMPAVLGGNKINQTPLEFGVAMSNALTHGAGDTTGKRSATAQISLEMQMAAAFPELKDTAERIEAMRADPALRDAFLEGKEHKGKKLQGLQTEFTGPDGQILNLDAGRYSGERRMQPAIKALLTAGSAEASIMDETLKTLPSVEKSGPSYERRAAQAAADPNFRVAEKNQIAANVAEQNRIKDTGGATGSVARNSLEELMSSEGLGSFRRTDARWSMTGRELLGQTPSQAAINTAEANAAEFQNRAARAGAWGSPTQEKDLQETADKFGRVAETLRKQEAVGDTSNTTADTETKLRASADKLSLMRRTEGSDPKAVEELRLQTEALYDLIRTTKEDRKRPLNPGGNVER